MQKAKTFLTASAVAAAAALTAPAATASEVEASVGLSSLYLFRGMDLSDGGPQMFGDLTVSEAGFYASIWGSSENSTESSGGEYDLIAGYGTEIGGVAVGLGVVNYIYPGAGNDNENDDIGGFSEAFLTLGFADFEVTYWNNIAGFQGYEYLTLGYTCDQWSFLLGHARFDHNGDQFDDLGNNYDSTEGDYTHIDITYAATDNLSFTVSKIVDRNAEGTYSNGMSEDASDIAGAGSENRVLRDLIGEDDTLFIVSYSLPIEIK